MRNSFLKKTAIILSLLIGGSGIIVANNKSQSTFLFALQKSISPLEISKLDNTLLVDNSSIQDFINSYNIQNIEPWILGANENDYDGDIYLNRIYRVYVDQDRTNLDFLISVMDSKTETIYAEPEYLRKPLYTPNDPAFNQQCSLPSVKATSAWDFWDIPNVMPGSVDGREILLASVDTGVDYIHPDLVESIWVNQGEIPQYIIDDLFEIIDTNGDGTLSSLELVSEEIMTDLNQDGLVNLKDIFVEGSPYLDGLDNDGNGYADDLIGWDPAGTWGMVDPDPDPYPRTDPPATDGGTWAHGSHVAGILAATSDNSVGMASTVFNGKIISVKCSLDGTQTDDPGISNGYDGILYAAKAGYYNSCPNCDPNTDESDSFAIINNSWGGGGPSTGEQAVINTAHNTYGAIVLAAAGNGDDNGGGGGEDYSSHYPASYDNVISVCAIGCNGDWGGWATYHPTVDLAAPGENVYSAIMNGGYASWMGSSMASPNAASCIGLLQAYYPEMNNDQLIERILNTADRFIYDRNPGYETCNEFSGTDCLGKGMVDIYEAIGIEISPNIIIDSTVLTEDSDAADGDGIINPGEHFWIQINLINEEGWQDAADINAVLSTNYDGVTINTDSQQCSSLGSGETCTAEYDFTLSDDIALGDIEFNLLTTATGPDNFQFEANLSLEVNVSLNQAGFPVDVSGELISSAAIVDLDNDGENEIISSDKGGFVHVFEMDGTEWSDDTFPYETGDQNWGSPAVGDDGSEKIAISSKNGNIYIINDGGAISTIESGSFVTATPAFGDVDGDGMDEIVFGQYGGDKLLYAINSDGSNIDGFPVSLDEKVQRGVALADFNGNGKMDIVVGTDDEFIHLIHDDGSIVWSYETGGDIRVAPTVLELNTGEKIVLAGSKDDNFYALNSDGTLRFMIETDDDISTEASVVDIDGVGPVIFFASGSMVYGVETDGNIYGDWTIEVADDVTSSIVFSDIDGILHVMFGDESGNAYMYDIQGNAYTNFPISYNFGFKGSPTVIDTDSDGDLELVIGSTQTLTNIDVKESGSVEGLWSTHRANMQRNGYFVSDESVLDISSDILEKEFSITSVYPNPFNPSVSIDYFVNVSDFVEINIINLEGKVIETIESSFKPKGAHSVMWAPGDIASGIYLLNITSSNKIATQKLMFIK